MTLFKPFFFLKTWDFLTDKICMIFILLIGPQLINELTMQKSVVNLQNFEDIKYFIFLQLFDLELITHLLRYAILHF